MQTTKRSHTMRLIMMGMLLSLWSWQRPFITHAKGDTPQEVGQVLVEIDPLSGATIDDINATYGTSTLATLTAVSNLYLLQAPPNEPANELADRMALDPRLLFAEPNYIGQAPEADGSASWAWGGQDDTPYQNQYAPDALNLFPAHAHSTGSGTTVAILDTGVDLDHPALATSLVPGYDFVDHDDTPNDELTGNPTTDSVGGHGTHIAGIVHLVAPDAHIMPIRVLDVDGRGNVYMLAEAIVYAVDNGADIINLSLGMNQHADTLENAIQYATRRGVVVVAAAGNLGEKDKQHPAATQCALAVTAVSATNSKTDFANYGSWISYAAPGESIYSTYPDGSYASWSGTSMATPFVAGQAALLRSLDDTLDVRDIALLIAHTSQNLDAENGRYRGKLGAGLPNITASINQLLSSNLPTANRGFVSSQCLSPT